MMNRRQGGTLLCLVLGCFAGAARADVVGVDGVFDTVSVYAARGIDHNLREMPGVLMGDASGWRWENSYFGGVGFGKERGTLGKSFPSLQGTPLAGWRHGYEVILLKHSGRQHNGEIGAAYMLRTPDLNLGAVAVNAAVGGGLSYALGKPTYEDGPEGDPSRRYRLQGLAIFEAEWRLKGNENWAITTRLHHRCGVYGIIAPKRVGSNFAGLGVRYRF